MSDDDIVEEVTTDEDGWVEFEADPGTYTVTVTSAEYGELTREITVESGETTVQTVEVEPDDGTDGGDDDGDEPITVTGRVTNPDGNGVGGATLAFDEETEATTNNDTGSFELELTPGEYDVDVDATGFDSTSETVVVEEGTDALEFTIAEWWRDEWTASASWSADSYTPCHPRPEDTYITDDWEADIDQVLFVELVERDETESSIDDDMLVRTHEFNIWTLCTGYVSADGEHLSGEYSYSAINDFGFTVDRNEDDGASGYDVTVGEYDMDEPNVVGSRLATAEEIDERTSLAPEDQTDTDTLNDEESVAQAVEDLPDGELPVSLSNVVSAGAVLAGLHAGVAPPVGATIGAIAIGLSLYETATAEEVDEHEYAWNTLPDAEPIRGTGLALVERLQVQTHYDPEHGFGTPEITIEGFTDPATACIDESGWMQNDRVSFELDVPLP